MNNENKKKLCVSGLVLGIVGVVFSMFFPFISYACSIPGLAVSLKNRKKDYNTKAGLILNTVAIGIAAVNSALGIIMTVKLFFSAKNDEE